MLPDPTLPPVVIKVFKAAVPHAIAAYQRRQAEKSHAAIVKRLKAGKPWAISEDKAAAAMWRYMRATTEGAALRNLELLADALVNGAVDPEFAPDEFKRQADRLEGLDRDEILALAAFIRSRHLEADENGTAIVVRYKAAVADLIARGHFADEDAVDACLSSLARTGFVAASSGFGFFGYVGTKHLDAVARLVDFDSAEAREFDGSDLS
jgi:hypothetical protein